VGPGGRVHVRAGFGLVVGVGFNQEEEMAEFQAPKNGHSALKHNPISKNVLIFVSFSSHTIQSDGTYAFLLYTSPLCLSSPNIPIFHISLNYLCNYHTLGRKRKQLS